ncbi:hypothetical protein H0N95_01355, partial [Candidatus Micrarchaeota archaeon]|nr:hypothetical protein [Candidatus Micrarchaeota archaeon]
MNHNGFHLPNFREEMTELYANRVVRYFGMSLVYVFIPVYLLSLGFSFQQAVLYIILKRLFMAMTVPLAIYSDGRVGIKRTALISAFVLSAFLLYLYSEFSVSLTSIVILGLLEGLDMSLYWVPMNIDFGLASKKGKRGEETAAI